MDEAINMKDKEVIELLKSKINKRFHYSFDGDSCVKLSLCDSEKTVFSGIIRHYSYMKTME